MSLDWLSRSWRLLTAGLLCISGVVTWIYDLNANSSYALYPKDPFQFSIGVKALNGSRKQLPHSWISVTYLNSRNLAGTVSFGNLHAGQAYEILVVLPRNTEIDLPDDCSGVIPKHFEARGRMIVMLNTSGCRRKDESFDFDVRGHFGDYAIQRGIGRSSFLAWAVSLSDVFTDGYGSESKWDSKYEWAKSYISLGPYTLLINAGPGDNFGEVAPPPQSIPDIKSRVWEVKNDDGQYTAYITNESMITIGRFLESLFFVGIGFFLGQFELSRKGSPGSPRTG